MRITINGKLKKVFIQKTSFSTLLLNSVQTQEQAILWNTLVKCLKYEMEGRMTVCNMSIEMGARGGMIAPDQTTFDYMNGREFPF